MGKSLSPLLILLLFCGACSTVRVSQDYNSEYVFPAGPASYNWNNQLQQDNSGLLAKDELLAKRFVDAIEIVLENKGFIQSTQPLYLVSCLYNVTNKLESDPLTTGFNFGYGRHGRYGGVGVNSGTYIRQYQEAKLDINIHLSASGQLIWRGTGTQEVFTHSPPAEKTNNAVELVTSILAQFPPVK